MIKAIIWACDDLTLNLTELIYRLEMEYGKKGEHNDATWGLGTKQEFEQNEEMMKSRKVSGLD